MTSRCLQLGHSPDPDDAFMWWPLLEIDGTGPAIDTGAFEYRAVIQDIETLNRRSESGDMEITAMSCAQYPRVHDRYAVTACGASLGDGYGPRLVAREGVTIESLLDQEAAIAVPGRRTSAFATLRLMLGTDAFTWREVPFEQIIDEVAAGRFAAGLVIHEGQLTHQDAGLYLLADLGAWWTAKHDLPLPLGLNTVRRDLEIEHGPGTLRAVSETLHRSVEHALANRRESIDYAMRYARNMGRDLADQFIGLYVNRWTLDFGRRGRAAVQAFLDAVAEAGLAPAPETVEFV